MADELTKFSEAKDEARRLTKVIGRDVESQQINCACDYDKKCGKCGGQGYYYKFAYSFCGHFVEDGDEPECRENEYADSEREEADTERDPSGVLVLKAEGPQIPGCANSEQEEMEAAILASGN